MASTKRKDEGSMRTCPAEEYVVAVEAARFYRQTRYYWTVCRARKPDELIAWGDAPSRQDAEEAARSEVADLADAVRGGAHTSPSPQMLKRHVKR